MAPEPDERRKLTRIDSRLPPRQPASPRASPPGRTVAGAARWVGGTSGPRPPAMVARPDRDGAGAAPARARPRPGDGGRDGAAGAGGHRGDGRGGQGVEANARLTGMTAAILLVLLAVEGLSILRIGTLITLHVVLGMVLVPLVAVKIASTTWRFARYYLGAPEYRRKGPPPPALRLLGPFIVVLTIILLATGIALLFAPVSLRSELLFLHRASFILWFAAMVVHVLGHFLDTARLAPRDFYWRTRRQVRGAGARQWVLVGALAAGLLLGILIAPRVTFWRNGAHVPTQAPVTNTGTGATGATGTTVTTTVPTTGRG